MRLKGKIRNGKIVRNSWPRKEVNGDGGGEGGGCGGEGSDGGDDVVVKAVVTLWVWWCRREVEELRKLVILTLLNAFSSTLLKR